MFNDPRAQGPSHGQLGWPTFPDHFFQGYVGQQPGGHDQHFYSGDSSASTPQLVNSPASFMPTPQSAASPVSPALPPSSLSGIAHHHQHHHAPPPSAQVQRCMWANCGATFATMNELVGHVNLQHLRLPTPAVAQPTPQPSRNDMASSLSCLWADCQVYPTPSSVPGPSMGNQADKALGVLASHLFEDHLGLATPMPTPRNSAPQKKRKTSEASTISPPVSSPPTPAPEHDCSAPAAHVCRWVGCGESFASCDALTAHINATHVGSGKAHYDCHWEGCARHGDNGFASKQKICRHLQVYFVLNIVGLS